jgi:hypothetical protein
VDNGDIRDFALGGITGIDLLDVPAIAREVDDVAWMARVPVSPFDDPRLAPAQRGLIRFEHLNNSASQTDYCAGRIGALFHPARASRHRYVQKRTAGVSTGSGEH